MSSLEQALSLWRRGFSVFPVPHPDGSHDGKRPIASWLEFQTRRLMEDELAERFNKLGMDPHSSSPEELMSRLVADIKKWNAVIDKAGIPRK